MMPLVLIGKCNKETPNVQVFRVEYRQDNVFKLYYAMRLTTSNERIVKPLAVPRNPPTTHPRNISTHELQIPFTLQCGWPCLFYVHWEWTSSSSARPSLYNSDSSLIKPPSNQLAIEITTSWSLEECAPC